MATKKNKELTEEDEKTTLLAQLGFGYIRLMKGGGRVKRFHTEHIIGEELVATHTFGVICWVMALTDRKASRNLILAALYHDIDEQISGDAPGPFKWANPVFNMMLTRMHEDFARMHGLYIDLTIEERNTLDWADKFDVLTTCYEQQRLGNELGREMCSRVVRSMVRLPDHPIGSRMLELWIEQHPEHAKPVEQEKDFYAKCRAD